MALQLWRTKANWKDPAILLRTVGLIVWILTLNSNLLLKFCYFHFQAATQLCLTHPRIYRPRPYKISVVQPRIKRRISVHASLILPSFRRNDCHTFVSQSLNIGKLKINVSLSNVQFGLSPLIQLDCNYSGKGRHKHNRS